MFGVRPSAVATLVDRATRYTMVIALPDGYKADAVAEALARHMGTLPASLRRSLTWDRGREMAAHTVINSLDNTRSSVVRGLRSMSTESGAKQPLIAIRIVRQ